MKNHFRHITVKFLLSTFIAVLSLAQVYATGAEAENNKTISAFTTRLVHEIVQPGDTLQEIARRQYGNSRYWPFIWQANKKILRNPDTLRQGSRLKIPSLKTMLQHEGSILALHSAYRELVEWYQNVKPVPENKLRWIVLQAEKVGLFLNKTTDSNLILKRYLEGSDAPEPELYAWANSVPEGTVLDTTIADLEAKANQVDASPQVHFALALLYKRKNLLQKEYQALVKAEEAALKAPSLSFNILLVNGRKGLIEGNPDASNFLQATLELTAIPEGTSIYLDDVAIGQGTISLKIPAGKHKLSLQYPNYLPVEEEIELTLGQIVNRQISLKPVHAKTYTNSIGLTMIEVAAGSFNMGDTAGGGMPDELPVHEVHVQGFSISSTEITNDQFKRVLASTRGPVNSGKHPVTGTSWLDAVTFCNALSKLENKEQVYTIKGEQVSIDYSADGYRLPTEAEWEYAAKGGPVQQPESWPFAGSKTAEEVAWYPDLKPVATLKPNTLGLFDMSGNAAEWCNNFYEEYTNQRLKSPLGLQYSVLTSVHYNKRMLRGSPVDGATDLRVSGRDGLRGNQIPGAGFRVVVASPESRNQEPNYTPVLGGPVAKRATIKGSIMISNLNNGNYRVMLRWENQSGRNQTGSDSFKIENGKAIFEFDSGTMPAPGAKANYTVWINKDSNYDLNSGDLVSLSQTLVWDGGSVMNITKAFDSFTEKN